MADSLEKGYSPTGLGKTTTPTKGDGEILPDYSSPDSPTHHDGMAGQHKTVADAVAEEPFLTRLGVTLDSFKPRDYGRGVIELERSMKARHLHMIAIGGSIGAGFFVGSGGALSTGGPGSLLIDFLIIGIMMFNVVYALGEMAVMYPVSGGFYTLSARFIDPSWGFAMVSRLELSFVFVTQKWARVDGAYYHYPLLTLTRDIWGGASSQPPFLFPSAPAFSPRAAQAIIANGR